MTPADINQSLCALLGVDTSSHDITSVTLQLQAHSAPIVTIERQITPWGTTAGQINTHTQHYHLQADAETNPPPLDLDAMATAAMQRVQRHIDKVAKRQIRKLECAGAVARDVMQQRHADELMRHNYGQWFSETIGTLFKNGPLFGTAGGAASVTGNFFGRAAYLDPQRGHATLANTAVAAAMALALAWLGPTVLDAAPDGPGTYSAYGYTPADLEPGQAALLDAQARAACARGAHGADGGYVALADGAVMCTDKRGRHARPAAMKGGA